MIWQLWCCYGWLQYIDVMQQLDWITVGLRSGADMRAEEIVEKLEKFGDWEEIRVWDEGEIDSNGDEFSELNYKRWARTKAKIVERMSWVAEFSFLISGSMVWSGVRVGFVSTKVGSSGFGSGRVGVKYWLTTSSGIVERNLVHSVV